MARTPAKMNGYGTFIKKIIEEFEGLEVLFIY
jgi:hypothetical protein